MGKFFAPIIALLGCISCSETLELPDSGDNVQISVNIQADNTRTGISGGTLVFLANDQIGVSETLTSRNNVQFTYNGSAWSTPTPMYWYNGTATHTFYAYYPYNASNQNTTVSLPILNNQAFGTAPDYGYDLLVSGPKTQVRTAGTNVPLTFTHGLTLLQFTITAPLISTFTLQTMTLNAGNTAGGANPYGIVNTTNTIGQLGYQLTSKTLYLPAAGNTSANFAQTVTKPIATTGVIGTVPIIVNAIVLPGQYGNPIPGIQFQVYALLTGTKSTSAARFSTNPVTFAPGTKYSYNVQIGGLIGLRSGNTEPAITIELTDIQPLRPEEFMPAIL